MKSIFIVVLYKGGEHLFDEEIVSRWTMTHNLSYEKAVEEAEELLKVYDKASYAKIERRYVR